MEKKKKPAKTKLKVPMTLSLDKSIAASLRTSAAEHDMEMSAMVTEALVQYWNNDKGRG